MQLVAACDTLGQANDGKKGQSALGDSANACTKAVEPGLKVLDSLLSKLIPRSASQYWLSPRPIMAKQ